MSACIELDATQSLSSEYLRIKRSYRSSKQKTETENALASDSSDDIGDDECSRTPPNQNRKMQKNLNTVSIEKAPSMPPLPPASRLGQLQLRFDNDCKTFLQRLKTAGLRASREKLLLEQFHQLAKDQGEALSFLISAIKSWTCFGTDLKRFTHDLGRKVEYAVDEKNELEVVVEEANDARIRLESKVDELEQEIDANRDEMQDLKNRNETEMNAFLDEMELKVEQIRGDMSIEMERRESKVQWQMEEEKTQEVQKVREKLALAEKNKEDYAVNLSNTRKDYEALTSRFRRESEESQTIIAKLRLDIEGLTKKLQTQQTENEQAVEKVRVLEEEYQQSNVQRELDLADIEKRVKCMILAKDEQIKEVTKRAEMAEHRTSAFQQSISQLEDEFIELPPELGSK